MADENDLTSMVDDFIIGPVRNVSPQDAEIMDKYVAALEAQGRRVHYPKRDTNQVDPTGGTQICMQNGTAIYNARVVHVYWTQTSQGTYFDLGMAFMLRLTRGKPIKLINKSDVEKIVQTEKKAKSFEHVLLELDNPELYRGEFKGI